MHPFTDGAAMAASVLLLGLGVATLATSVISGILGMAGGMLLMGGLLAVMPVPTAMVLHGITQFGANAWRAWLWRDSIRWSCIGGFALGVALATAALGSTTFVLSRPLVLVSLGVTPFLTLLLPRSIELNVDRRGQPFVAGLVATAVQLLSGVSGPLLDSFFVRSSMDRKAVVATKAAAQTLGHLAKTLYFGGMAGLSTVDPSTCLVMVACAVAGTSASRYVLERMSDEHFRSWTRLSVMTIGATCVVSGAWSLLG
jgi:uncharacterized protein